MSKFLQGNLSLVDSRAPLREKKVKHYGIKHSVCYSLCVNMCASMDLPLLPQSRKITLPDDHVCISIGVYNTLSCTYHLGVCVLEGNDTKSLKINLAYIQQVLGPFLERSNLEFWGNFYLYIKIISDQLWSSLQFCVCF